MHARGMRGVPLANDPGMRTRWPGSLALLTRRGSDPRGEGSHARRGMLAVRVGRADPTAQSHVATVRLLHLVST